MKNKLLNLLYIITIIIGIIVIYMQLYEILEFFNYKLLLYLFIDIFFVLLISKWLVDNIKEKRF